VCKPTAALASPPDSADPGHASEPFRLPDTFACGGDPVGGNPFPSDDPLHRVWAERTRNAEETINRLTADALSTNGPYTAASAATLIVAKFDAWAERAVSVVWCDRALQHCDQWLVAEANIWIDEVARTGAEATPPFNVNPLLRDLRRRLGAQVYAWKAAARRVCADYQAAMSNPAAESPGSSEHVLGANPYREGDPHAQGWTSTNQLLADSLARIHSAFFAALPRHHDAATVVDWLASWIVGPESEPGGCDGDGRDEDHRAQNPERVRSLRHHERRGSGRGLTPAADARRDNCGTNAKTDAETLKDHLANSVTGKGLVVARDRIELSTLRFSVVCSTN
jgi:hypothetical protein